jgi:nucleoside-diphosphate-sugar epimerase
LKDAGHHIIGLDTGWFLGDYAEMPEWPDLVLFADIRAPRVLPNDMEVVVHLAGLSNDPLGDLNPDLTRRINEIATLDLIRHYPDARHVIISSCSVYGHTDDAATEATEVRPLTAYAQAKAWVDYNAPLIAENVISLRLGTVWGYSPGHRLDLVVNRMMFDAIHKGVVTVSGSSWRPLVHIEDVATAITHYAENDVIGVHNIVGDNAQMDDLGTLIAEYAGVNVEQHPETPDKRDYTAASEYGAEHSVFNEDDLRDLWVNTQLLPVMAADPTDRYTRLNSIRRLKNLGLLDNDLRRIA